jgi:hypothetical protein
MDMRTMGSAPNLLAPMDATVMVVVVVAMTMLVLSQSRLIVMRVSAMRQRQRDVEAMRLGNRIDRLAVGSEIGEWERLPDAVWSLGFQAYGVGPRTGNTEIRRDAGLEDREKQLAVMGRYALQLRTMNAAASKIVEFVGMAMAMTVVVTGSMRRACRKLTLGRDRDPATEGH